MWCALRCLAPHAEPLRKGGVRDEGKRNVADEEPRGEVAGLKAGLGEREVPKGELPPHLLFFRRV